ncbi:serine hydrolase [Parabacteroides sp. PF5-9]|uniref:serine hydrolase domain-containing protein n=1 Tax=Parabacteroides sp. PF5-9 TaxID=1742404 RepID=UPI002476E91E|nr:serine hydrolase [Parabacteroides sp. PF5-9]MDH6356946.1 CubicO group peptidase (beta-lactamase class C family) [Parabacteroides sp. PF5-9]
MKRPEIRILLATLVALTLLNTACREPKLTNSNYSDGMYRSTPELQGVASEGIHTFIEEAEAQMELHSLMFLRHGKVIAEGWWHPYRSTTNHLMHSVSKTFTSTAIGFAVQEQLLTVEDRVISFFPDKTPQNPSQYLQELRVKDLLTMSVGQTPPPTFYITDHDWVKSFLDTNIQIEPGTTFEYSSYATYMLSAIIHKVTGESTYDYLTPRLFEPLEIKNIQWETDTQGINSGGWGMRIKTADMAKLGQFYLQKGKWHNKQLLSADWIDEATAPHIYQRPDRTPDENSNDDWAQGYGYQIWRCTHNAYRADGANGQFIIILPEQDAVIAITASLNDMQKELSLVWKHLLPAIISNRPIKKDEAANELLTSKLSSLKIPDPSRTNDEVEAARNITYTFSMNPNEQQISELTLHLDAQANCLLTLTTIDKQYPLSFGNDTWKFGETERLSPYFSSPRRNPEGLLPLKTAGFGSWITKDNLKLTLLYVTDARSETFDCQLAGNKITVTLTNSMSPSDPPILLTGQFKEQQTTK